MQKYAIIFKMAELDSNPEIFVGSDSLSTAITHSLTSKEGVAVIDGAYGYDDIDDGVLWPYFDSIEAGGPGITDKQNEAASQMIIDLVEKAGSISTEVKQLIIDTHFAGFPIAIRPDNIALYRSFVKQSGSPPHIDQTYDSNTSNPDDPNWNPNNLYSGIFLSLAFHSNGEWKTWVAGDSKIEVVDNNSVLGVVDALTSGDPSKVGFKKPDKSFEQRPGRIVVLRQQDVIHAINAPASMARVSGLADIGLVLDLNTLTDSERVEVSDWTRDKAKEVITRALFSSAVMLKPAEEDSDTAVLAHPA